MPPRIAPWQRWQSSASPSWRPPRRGVGRNPSTGIGAVGSCDGFCIRLSPRSIHPLCVRTSPTLSYVELVVDRGDYARLAFLPSGAVVARVPPDSTESLRGPISTEDLEYGLQQLPNGKAPDDSGLPYELLKGAIGLSG